MPQKIKDETGKKYGRLLVLFEATKTSRHAKWVCRCDCGATTIVVGIDLRRGASQSCGCMRKEKVRGAFLKKARGNALDMFDEDIL